ncbi:unnamed protein product [Pocillopora meandrina]|uniref:TNF receptor-associated factor 3 n=1 Tax=Pocillopora meandrina TaxID=46732 RepID=A0AAU9W649_9CNID|nr:unnamed protein product [Pocillopora meandrina]
MAAGQNVPQLGGYEYKFTSKVPEDYECLVCHLPMKDPVQIVQCGHKLCSSCKESLFGLPSPLCPADRQPLSREQIFPDTACRRKILDLTVKCSHSGCPWTGELRAVEEHQSNCLLKVVQCPNSGCTEKVTKQDMRTHVTSECSWRIIHCEYCQTLVSFNKRKKHFHVCQKFPVHCTNKCGLEEIPREKLELHIGKDCPVTVVYCEFKKLGCDAKFPRSNTKAHSKTQIEQHLNLALRSLETTQRLVNDQSQQIELLMAKNKDTSQQIEQLMAKDKDTSQQIEQLMARHEETSRKIERLTAKDKKKSQQIEQLIAKDKDTSQQIEQLMARHEETSRKIIQLTAKDEKKSQQIEQLMAKDKYTSQQIERLTAHVKVQDQHIRSLNSPLFVWKISNFTRAYRRAASGIEKIITNTFYLSSNGYRLRIKIFFNAKQAFGRLSFFIYICVVPGEFDPLLSWPFKEKVRVTLINQNPCKDEEKNICRVTDFGNLDMPIMRPLNEDNERWHVVLGPDFGLSRSLELSDTIFIMVQKE